MSAAAESSPERGPQRRGDAHASARPAQHEAAPHGTRGSYATGFILSVVLTAIPFWLVMSNVLGNTLWTSIVIMAFAAVQIVVHMIYFLHMNTKSEGGWTFLALAFTLTLVVVTLVGSIWVMYHMDQNMMPMSPHEALTRP